MKPSYIAVALLAIILPLAGFVVGIVVSSGTPITPLSQQEQTSEAPEPPPESLSMPGEDVPGEDLQSLSRYPGSVRIEYIEEKQGEVVWTELEYLTDASLEQAREFYRDSFRTEGWEVNDIGFAQSSWIFFVVKDNREVFVEIRPRGGVVEVDIEQTEPLAQEQTDEPTQNADNQQTDDDVQQSTPQQSTPQQSTPQQSTPQQSAPQQSAPQQSAPQQSAPQQVVPEDDDDDAYEVEDDEANEGYDD